jgi:hypothetical protein
MKRSFIAIVVLSLGLAAGCGGGGAGIPNQYAGRWAGPYTSVPQGETGVIDIDVAENGTAIITIDPDNAPASRHVGYCTEQGAIGGIPPIVGKVEKQGVDLLFAFTRDAKAIAVGTAVRV